MRMFLYYALHYFVNQIRKIFKTWVFVFILICFVFGIGIGLFAAGVSNLADSRKEQQQVEESVDTPNEQEEEEAEVKEERKDTFTIIREKIGMGNFMELIAAAVMVLIFGLAAMNADKNAGKVFLPADVTLLFASPLKPQSVLLFRIGMQIGTTIFLGFYMLLQLPNLAVNAKLGVPVGIAVIIAFCVITFLSTLLQLMLYLLGTISEKFKKYMRPGLIALVAGVVALYFSYQKSSGLEHAIAASNFFNASGTRWIPFFGWMKGFVRAAVDGEWMMAAIFMALTVVGCAVVIWIMWRLKVDFYEDAMAKCEEVAALIEASKAKNAGLIVKRKKDRSDKLQREGIGHGWGANVFFFKNMYNRFRFAHFRFFTKTMEFYFCVAIALALVCRFSIGTNNALILAAAFAVCLFVRSLGNVLDADTKMDYFVMIPESAFSKMFYSMLAELCNTALDLIFPMIVGTLIMGGNLLLTIVMVFVLLSVNIYSTSVGCFIGVTVPVNAGTMVKQFVQILFVYFGLLPDIVVLVICAVLGQVVLGIILAVAVNVLLGLLFFALAAHALEPRGGSVVQELI
ncbi:MAG: hypothetical protein J6U66_00465 [Lachnospiraceae bacterium]|nr:hypothetical protein [Lachnospiraceae bacterium]